MRRKGALENKNLVIPDLIGDPSPDLSLIASRIRQLESLGQEMDSRLRGNDEV